MRVNKVWEKGRGRGKSYRMGMRWGEGGREKRRVGREKRKEEVERENGGGKKMRWGEGKREKDGREEWEKIGSEEEEEVGMKQGEERKGGRETRKRQEGEGRDGRGIRKGME